MSGRDPIEEAGGRVAETNNPDENDDINIEDLEGGDEAPDLTPDIEDEAEAEDETEGNTTDSQSIESTESDSESEPDKGVTSPLGNTVQRISDRNGNVEYFRFPEGWDYSVSVAVQRLQLTWEQEHPDGGSLDKTRYCLPIIAAEGVTNIGDLTAEDIKEYMQEIDESDYRSDFQ